MPGEHRAIQRIACGCTASCSSTSSRRWARIDERAGDRAHHTLYSRIKTGIGIKGLYARPTQYGMEKGIEYSKELGADEDKISVMAR